MGTTTTPENTDGKDMDVLVLATGVAGLLKLALAGTSVTPSGSDTNAAVQAVGIIGCGTPTLANVASSASSVTLIASNANRRGATIWNDSGAILYVKFGSAASATSCTVKMVADAYFEVPFGYTGIITGIWASATGSARVTELAI